jgi:hypothetical protein
MVTPKLLTEYLVEMFAGLGLPPVLMEAEAWTQFLSKCTGLTDFPSEQTIRRRLEDEYSKVRVHVADLLFSSTSVALAFDNWDAKNLTEFTAMAFRVQREGHFLTGMAFMVPIERGLLFPHSILTMAHSDTLQMERHR